MLQPATICATCSTSGLAAIIVDFLCPVELCFISGMDDLENIDVTVENVPLIIQPNITALK